LTEANEGRPVVLDKGRGLAAFVEQPQKLDLVMDFPASTSGGGSGTDYLSEYRSISNKLKKRFLRRPNLSEASDQFLRLAKRLEQRDSDEGGGGAAYQAAICHLAVAKCEQSIGNQQGEVEAFTAAARAAFRAEINVRNINCNSIQQHLTEAISNYCNAIRLLEEMDNTVEASGLCLELAGRLRDLGKVGEAMRFYQRAADLRSLHLGLEYVHSREKVASCLIDIGDLHNALVVLTEVANVTVQLASGVLGGVAHGVLSVGGAAAATPLTSTGSVGSARTAAPTSVYADILARCEISRVLLVLLIEPQSMSPAHTGVIEKYTWEADLSGGGDKADGGRNDSSGGSSGSDGGGSGAKLLVGGSCHSGSKAAAEEQLQLPPHCLSEETFLLLQSVVMAVQVRDTEALAELEDCLIPHISGEPQQRQLLRRLVATSTPQ